jgi:hypothetical protein
MTCHSCRIVRLPREEAHMILHCLLEGDSVRSSARPCDVEPKTVLAMLALAGANCERILARSIRNVPVTDVQREETEPMRDCGAATALRQAHRRLPSYLCAPPSVYGK